MNNKSILILVIIVVMFSAFAFLVPFERETVFWVAYVAELIAVALQVPIFKTAFENTEDVKSKVLGFPVARVGYIYLGVQTVVSLALMPLGFVPIPSWIAVLACVIVLGFALICSVSVQAARQEIEKIEASVKLDTSLMMELRTRSAQLVNKASDPAVKKQLENLADNIRFSDPVSSTAIASYEQKLADEFANLEAAVVSNSSNVSEKCRSVQSALDDRNTACKMNKKR